MRYDTVEVTKLRGEMAMLRDEKRALESSLAQSQETVAATTRDAEVYRLKCNELLARLVLFEQAGTEDTTVKEALDWLSKIGKRGVGYGTGYSDDQREVLARALRAARKLNADLQAALKEKP